MGNGGGPDVCPICGYKQKSDEKYCPDHNVELVNLDAQGNIVEA